MLGASGCSSSPDTPEATLAAFLHALGEGDVEAACALVVYDKEPLQGDDLLLCQGGFRNVVEQVATEQELAQLRAAEVTGSAVSGDQATVLPEQIEGVPAAYELTVSLVRIDGTWFVVSTP